MVTSGVMFKWCHVVSGYISHDVLWVSLVFKEEALLSSKGASENIYCRVIIYILFYYYY